MRMRLIAVVAAVVALLAPPAVANAAPPYELTIHSEIGSVYPVVDGFLDSTLIEGTVEAGGASQRIRGTVVISVGSRVVKSVILTTTGDFSFRWNGRTAKGVVVTGTATVMLRVDGQAPVTTTIKVSPKKVVALTLTKTEVATDGFWCWDAAFPWVNDPHDFDFYCPTSYGHPIPDYAYMTMRGSKTTGGLMYIGRFWDNDEVLQTSVLPVKVSVTGTFRRVAGSGTSRIWVRPAGGDLDFSAGSNPIRSFTGTTTLTATGSVTINYAAGTYQPEWMVSVPAGVDLRVTTFKITVTYYKLR